MNTEFDVSAPVPPPPGMPRMGLAIAALVCGIFAVAASFLLIGGLFGLAGLVLAVMHFFRPGQRRGMAVGGLVLSLGGVAASIGFGALYFTLYDRYVTSVEDGGAVRDWVGVRAPDFTVTTIGGETFRLRDFQGKRVVVDYWATWCGPCVLEIPHFNQLRTEVPDSDLVLVGITGEGESVVKPFLETHKMIYPVASATHLPAPYSDIGALPTTIFIDRNGVIQSVLVGYRGVEVLKQHSTATDYEGEPKEKPDSAAGR